MVGNIPTYTLDVGEYVFIISLQQIEHKMTFDQAYQLTAEIFANLTYDNGIPKWPPDSQIATWIQNILHCDADQANTMVELGIYQIERFWSIDGQTIGQESYSFGQEQTGNLAEGLVGLIGEIMDGRPTVKLKSNIFSMDPATLEDVERAFMKKGYTCAESGGNLYISKGNPNPQ